MNEREEAVARIMAAGHKLAEQLGGRFEIDPRKLADFRVRAALASSPAPTDLENGEPPAQTKE